MRWFQSLVLSALILAASPVPGSAQGCLWCVTPTDCDYVDEDAAAECTERVGGPCSSFGFCFLIPNEDGQQTPEQRLLASIAQTNGPVVHLDTPLYGELPFVPIGGGEYGAFSCDGTLSLVARLDENGSPAVSLPSPTRAGVLLRAFWIEAGGFNAVTPGDR